MRLALFTPLPPARSGIADYSAALLEELEKIAAVDVFSTRPAAFDATRYDAIFYQIGNNPHHVFAYDAALEHPGIVVLHEANLHHLIAEKFIRAGDWDGYLREVAYDGGAAALVYAETYVRTLERGPDYAGVPMLRRLLERSRGVIVHSDCVAEEVRRAGFAGPVARIWHGAWLEDADRPAGRNRLGLDARTPLVGIFGFLKPYKRIAESLRAFARVVRLEPRARMILCGEVHPELPLDSLIAGLGLSAAVRPLGYTPLADFNRYLAACDIILNLRYPTVGESSGTLLRALGMGKATVVSAVGSFREYPDDVVLKVPVDATEEEHLFEFLNLLVSRPEVRRALGNRAREWVRRECSWAATASRYAAFAAAVRDGLAWPPPEPAAPAPAAAPSASAPRGDAEAAAPAPEPPVPAAYIEAWAPDPASKNYVAQHLTRFQKTLALTPPAAPGDRVLEMGAYLQITPALRTKLGYGEVRGCYLGPAGRTDEREAVSEEGERFRCAIDLFDAERDPFPYPDGYFATVLCCELLEHLTADPMHMMLEVNRILRPGGHFVLTTPNIASLRALAAILQGYHPMLFPAYLKPKAGGEIDARHAREFTPREIEQLLENSGFAVVTLETGPFREEPKPELAWVEHLLDQYLLTREHRGDGIYAVGRKTGPVRERYPAWLYS